MSEVTEEATTRERVLAAAAVEFAERGVAGARIDRIARGARTSKERLYAYFRSKTELYRVVAEAELAEMVRATPLDARDLPGFAGRVHDYFVQRPDHLRLLKWSQLDVLGDSAEEGDSYAEAMRKLIRSDVEQIAHAQSAGWLDATWDPIDVYVIVHQVAQAWVVQPDVAAIVSERVRDASPRARRAAVVAAVAAMFPAAGSVQG